MQGEARPNNAGLEPKRFKKLHSKHPVEKFSGTDAVGDLEGTKWLNILGQATHAGGSVEDPHLEPG